MSKADFDEFVRRQQSRAVDLRKWGSIQRDEWLQYLKDLYAEIESFLNTYIVSRQVRPEYRELNLNEQDIGPYTAQELVLQIGQQVITFTPIGTMLIGMKGRVDVHGPAGEARLVLVDKRATSARSLVPVTVIRGGAGTPLPLRATEPEEPIQWAWKIISRPPEIKFTELTQDSLFDMILEISNA